MAADRATGSGWAKLDQDGARGLADIIAGFSPRTFKSKVRMLLELYASLDRRGETSISQRRLAERAGVSQKQARVFLEELERNGDLIVCGTKKSAAGEHTVRCFSWTYPDSGGVRPKKGAGCALNPGEKGAHQSTQSTQRDRPGHRLGDGPAYDPAKDPRYNWECFVPPVIGGEV